MKNIISTIILVVFVIAGAVAADFVKSSGDAGKNQSSGADHAAKDKNSSKEKKDGSYKKEGAGKDKKVSADAHGGKDKGGKDKKGKDDHGTESTPGVGNYVKFNRQFVVPIVRKDRVTSLIILTLNLEVEPSIYDKAYALEPKLRANLMNELLVLSNKGAFSQNMTNPDNLKAVKKALFKTTRDLLGDEVKDILILELTRQDQ